MATATQSDESGRTELAASAGLGVIAAALGYLLTALLLSGEARDAVMAEVSEWKVLFWYFANAHMVDTEVSGSIGGFGGVDTVNFLAQSNAAGADLLYLVPPLVLVGVGALLAYRLDARDVGEAVFAGAPVALGYVLVLGIGAFVSRATMEASMIGVDVSGSIGPQLLPAILLAGLVYPLVFATVGAILVAVVR
ncbi:MAG: hypothetical protein ACQEQJ_08525 [Halobacteriota archaeon]